MKKKISLGFGYFLFLNPVGMAPQSGTNPKVAVITSLLTRCYPTSKQKYQIKNK